MRTYGKLTSNKGLLTNDGITVTGSAGHFCFLKFSLFNITSVNNHFLLIIYFSFKNLPLTFNTNINTKKGISKRNKTTAGLYIGIFPYAVYKVVH